LTRIAEDMSFTSHHQIHAVSNFLYALGMLIGSNFVSFGSMSVNYEGSLIMSSALFIPFIIVYGVKSYRTIK
jgi:hypothetical protein